MKCLRCGYCCTRLHVAVVIDPDKGLVEDNLQDVGTDPYKVIERCPWLRGDSPGEFSCEVHDRSWYPETPCAWYQDHLGDDNPCRMGVYVTNGRC